MNYNKYINSFCCIKVKGFKEKEYGILLEDGEEWIFLASLFADYMIDGYKLINKKHILSIDSSEKEIFTEKVLKASGKWDISNKLSIPLTTTLLFDYLFKSNFIFGLSVNKENVFNIGTIHRMLKKSFYLTSLSVKGEWLGDDLLFRTERIRTISFDTVYINSLVAYNKSLNEQSTKHV